jgi:phage repressor protein C with HTH and peptisase S24 domain
MGKTLGEKIKELRVQRCWTQEEVAQKLGALQQTVAHYEAGRRYPRKKYLDKLPVIFGKPLSYFLDESEEKPESFTVRVTYSKKFEEPTLLNARETDYLPVPIVEPKVAAGSPETVTSEEIVDIAYIHRRTLKRKNVRDYLCTFVKGDSMHPVIRDGAIVCIDTKAMPEEKKVPKGSVWAVRKDEGAVVKFIQIGEGGIILYSANPAYPPEVVRDPEAIIGRVVWMWQSLV